MQSGGKTKVSITVGDLCETCGKTCKRKKGFIFSSFSQKTGNWTAAKLLFTSIDSDHKISSAASQFTQSKTKHLV